VYVKHYGHVKTTESLSSPGTNTRININQNSNLVSHQER